VIIDPLAFIFFPLSLGLDLVFLSVDWTFIPWPWYRFLSVNWHFSSLCVGSCGLRRFSLRNSISI